MSHWAFWTEIPVWASVLGKATFLFALAWGTHAALRRADARWRMLVWRAVLIGTLFVGLTEAAGFRFWALLTLTPEPPPIARSQRGLVAVAAASVETRQAGVSVAEEAVSSAAEVASAEPRRWRRLFSVAAVWKQLRGRPGEIACAAWLLVTCVLLGRFWRAHRYVRRIARQSRPASEEWERLLGQCCQREWSPKRPPALRISDATRSPFLIGFFKPIIVLPTACAKTGDAELLRSILAHEIAHLESHDLPWSCALRVLGILFWFHPLAWGIPGAHASACEKACDAEAARAIGDVPGYSAALAQVALRLKDGAAPVWAASIPMARSSSIVQRLCYLKDNAVAARLSRVRLGVALALAALSVAALGGAEYAKAVEDTYDTPPPPPPSPARVLSFPTNRSLGSVWIEGDVPERRIETFYYWITDNESGPLGAARGNLIIPAGKRATLAISDSAAYDLTPLKKLPPDAFYGLAFKSRNERKPGDEVWEFISGLTGVRNLHLGETAVTAKGMQNLAKFPNLEYLTLPKVTTDLHLANIPGSERLKGLYFKTTGATDAGLVYLGRFPNLRELELGGPSITDAGLIHLQRLPNLEYLLLWGGFTDRGMKHLKRLPSLRILNPPGKIGNAGMEALAECPALERLDLFGSLVTDEGLRHLGRISTLKMVNVSPRGLPPYSITDKGLGYLKRCENLEVLHAVNANFSDAGLGHLSEMKRLREINVCPHYAINPRRFSEFEKVAFTDRGLAQLAALPLLEKLRIGSPAFTDDGMAVFSSMPRLKDLEIICFNVGNAGLANLAQVKTLTRLEFTRSSKISTSGVNHLNSLTNLRRLQVGDMALDGALLDLGRLTQLEELSVISRRDKKTRKLLAFRDGDMVCLENLKKLKSCWGFEGVSDVGAAHMAGLEQLERVTIAGAGLTDKTLGLFSNMKRLFQLNISGSFTDAGLQRLEGLHGLGFLNITNENAFSNEALERLRRALPDCHMQIVP